MHTGKENTTKNARNTRGWGVLAGGEIAVKNAVNQIAIPAGIDFGIGV